MAAVAGAARRQCVAYIWMNLVAKFSNRHPLHLCLDTKHPSQLNQWLLGIHNCCCIQYIHTWPLRVLLYLKCESAVSQLSPVMSPNMLISNRIRNRAPVFYGFIYSNRKNRRACRRCYLRKRKRNSRFL